MTKESATQRFGDDESQRLRREALANDPHREARRVFDSGLYCPIPGRPLPDVDAFLVPPGCDGRDE